MYSGHKDQDHSASYFDSLRNLYPQQPEAPPFTIEELQDALRMKNNKAPGSDGIHAEMITLLVATNEKFLLEYYNAALESEEVPSEWIEAL